MKKDTLKRELDWVSMLVPLAIVLTVCALFMFFPEGSTLVLSVVRGFLGDDFGLYYAVSFFSVGHYDFYIHHGCGYSVLFAVRVGAVCQ